MIAQFKIKNFRSILDMTLDFRFTEGKAPNGYKKWDTLPFLETGTETRLVPCLAIFGANASGKTNILNAMSTFRLAVAHKDAAVTTFYNPNKLHDGRETTVFELTTLLDGHTYTYQLEYNNAEIRQESLTKDAKSLYSVNQKNGCFAFEPRAEGYSTERLQAILDVECSDGNGHQTVCFLKRAAQNYPGLSADLKHMFDYIDKGIVVLQNNEIPLPLAVDMLGTLHSVDQTAALAEIVSIIRKLDFDVQSIAMKSRTFEATKNLSLQADGRNSVIRINHANKQVEIVDIKSSHNNIRGEPVTFDFLREESAGTQRIAGLVGMMLTCLRGGNTLFVDELENSLHPLLVKELIRVFKDKNYNRKGAQLVFTTHNTDILDNSILRMGEVAIVRKSAQTGSLVRRLVDFREDGLDVRNVTNFRKQYLDGFYSGIPHPAI
jgi:AAA15 family ATPase/GTPase